MHPSRLVAAILTLVALLALAVPAQAALVPTFRTEHDYFHCAGSNKVQNYELLGGRIPGWDTNRPTASVQDGAGCGYYENAVSSEIQGYKTALDAVWKGKFKGNLDKLLVELHTVYVGDGRATQEIKLRTELVINGNTVYSTPSDTTINVVPVPSETGASEKVTFTFTGIGIAPELGDGTIERDIQLVVKTPDATQHAWVFDAREVPAGLTFNPLLPEGQEVKVN